MGMWRWRSRSPDVMWRTLVSLETLLEELGASRMHVYDWDLQIDYVWWRRHTRRYSRTSSAESSTMCFPIPWLVM